VKKIKNYLLRGIPADLWKKFQAICKLEETTAREKLLKFIETISKKS